MKTIVTALFISIISFNGLFAQSSISGLNKANKLSSDKVKEIAKAGKSVTATSFMEEMTSKLKINEKQSSEIKPLAEQMLKDKAEVEATKMANDAKKNKLAPVYQAFDDRMKGLLNKIQWGKYLNWIKDFRK